MFEPLDTLDKLRAAHIAGRLIQCRNKLISCDAHRLWNLSTYSQNPTPGGQLFPDAAMRQDLAKYDYRTLVVDAKPILFDPDVSPAA